MEIDLLEVAVDWYPTDASKLSGWQKVAALFRHHFLDDFDVESSRSDLRQKWGAKKKPPEFVLPGLKGATRSCSDRMSHKPEVRARILRQRRAFQHFLDATIYLGEENGPVSFRIQNKTEDSRNPGSGTSRKLDRWECRARIEVTLRGSALGERQLTTLDNLRSFRFEDLRLPYFQFWLPTKRSFPREQLAAHTRLFEEGGTYAHELGARAQDCQRDAERSPAERRVALRRGTGKTGRMIAWTELNERTKRALRKLTEDWS